MGTKAASPNEKRLTPGSLVKVGVISLQEMDVSLCKSDLSPLVCVCVFVFTLWYTGQVGDCVYKTQIWHMGFVCEQCCLWFPAAPSVKIGQTGKVKPTLPAALWFLCDSVRLLV